MSEDIFPPAKGDGCEPFRAIAERENCNENLVLTCFRGLEVPEWVVSEHISMVKKNTHRLNEAARYAQNLLDALSRLSSQDREGLLTSGAPTVFQIEFLRDRLQGNADNLKSWGASMNRAGGRNPAAYVVAEGMRRLFRRQRRQITFGVDQSGGPSTDFGRGVEYAIGAFGLMADWRRPADEARGKHGRIVRRMARCAQARALRNPPPDLDMTGIEVTCHDDGTSASFVISLTDFPSVKPLRIDGAHYPTGRSIQELACKWAESVRSAQA